MTAETEKEKANSEERDFDPDKEKWEELPEHWYERDWWEWLEARLKFPFKAERVDDGDDAYFTPEEVSDEPFRFGQQMEVIKLEDEDEDYGILVEVRNNQENGTVPLADLEVCPKTDSNFKPVRRYAVWIANRDY